MRTKRLIIIFILFFLQGIFANIHHPIMPSYVSKLNLPDYMFGFFFAFMNLGMMIGAPLWGAYADSGKKKLSVVLGFVIYGSFQMIFGLGNVFGPWILSLIRFFSGFGIAASFTIIASEIIQLSEADKRAKNIALGAASLAIGGALGQFLGGQLYTQPFFIDLLKTDQFFNIFFVQFVTVILLALYVFIFYKPEQTVETSKRIKVLDGFKEIKNISKDLLLFLIALTFITIAAINVDKYLDVYFIKELGYKENSLGEFKMIVGFVGVFVSVVVVPLFMKFKRRLLLISIFQILSAVLVFIIFRANPLYFMIYLYSFYLVYIAIKTINEPLERDYISNFTTKENTATIMGVRHSFYSLGTIIGPIFGAFIYDYKPKILFYTSSVIFVVAIILISFSYYLNKRYNKINS